MTEPDITNQAVESDATPVFDEADIQKQNHGRAGLYSLFLPLIACPDSKFGRFHANQGLLLLILGFAGGIILSIIPIIGWILLPLFYILVLILGIMGLINGFGGKAKALPVIGKFRLLK